MALDLAMDLFFNLGTPERQCELKTVKYDTKQVFSLAKETDLSYK